MQRLQVVVDTSVLVCAARSRRGASYALMSRIEDPRWQMNISSPLVLEYEAKLKELRKSQGKDIQAVDGFLDYLLSVATRRNIFFKWRPGLSDPDDDLVLELAVASGARYIVTFNVKDFRRAHTFGCSPIRPGEFLRKLEESE